MFFDGTETESQLFGEGFDGFARVLFEIVQNPFARVSRTFYGKQHVRPAHGLAKCYGMRAGLEATGLTSIDVNEW